MPFKDYYGNPIEFDHVHVVGDTKNASGTIAVATQTTDGFMNTTDKNNLNTVENEILFMIDKVKQGLFTPPITQEEVNLTTDYNTSILSSMVYNMNGEYSVDSPIVINVTAQKIGTLTYSWTAKWIYYGPNWDYRDELGSGYFSSNKTNTLSTATILAQAKSSWQNNSAMEGTITITNKLEDKTSTITEQFSIFYFA